jgi:phosphate transport system substrate-binding protein
MTSTLLTAFAGLSLLSIAGCNASEDGKPDDPKLATTEVQSFGGVGSTFVAPIMDRWSTNFAKLHKVQVNYRAIGSGGGISELKKGGPTFAASDAPLSDDQLKSFPPILQIPVTAGPVCIVYNLPGVGGPLRLSGKALAGIFSGEIINWQDPAISVENLGAKLPHAAIILVHRSDGSGTTNILTEYLSSVSAVWAKKAGRGLTVEWPAGIGAEGSKTVLSTVKQNPGTIGYLELNYAKEAGLPVASIQNKAGEFVTPSPQSASLAVDAYDAALQKDLRVPVVDPPASARGAYPISGMTFVLIPRDDSVFGHRAAFKDFMKYVITSGQDSAEEMSYAKLPASLQRASQSLLAQLTDNGQPLK